MIFQSDKSPAFRFQIDSSDLIKFDTKHLLNQGVLSIYSIKHRNELVNNVMLRNMTELVNNEVISPQEYELVSNEVILRNMN